MSINVKIEEPYTPHVVLVLAALTATRVRGTMYVLVWCIHTLMFRIYSSSSIGYIQ